MLNASRYLLHSSAVRQLLDDRLITHRAFAMQLGVTRNYWSQLLCRRRHLTTRVRHALHEALPDIPADELWERIAPMDNSEGT